MSRNRRRRQRPAEARGVRRTGHDRVRRRADGDRPGQRLPLDRARLGIEFDEWDMPKVDKQTFMSTRSGRVLRRRRGVGAGKHHLGGGARPSGRDFDRRVLQRPAADRTPAARHHAHQSRRWASTSGRTPTTTTRDNRVAVPHADLEKSIAQPQDRSRARLRRQAARPKEAERCLNCDVQTVFDAKLCIECDACMDICPVDCINFIENDEKPQLRQALRVPALNTTQDIYVSARTARPAHHGQGRRRLPALRPVRRALSDRRLGHAEILLCGTAGREGLPLAPQCLPRTNEAGFIHRAMVSRASPA